MSNIGYLNDVYLSMRNELTRAVLKIVPPDTVEDIVQESYVRWCKLSGREEVEHPRAYLHRIARNLALDHVKSADQRLSTAMGDEEFSHPLEDATYREVVSNEEFGRFCDAVRQLPVQCRRVFVLKKVYSYTQAEIASELGISQSTVEKHIALGIKRCFEFMQEKESRVVKSRSITQSSMGKGGAE